MQVQACLPLKIRNRVFPHSMSSDDSFRGVQPASGTFPQPPMQSAYEQSSNRNALALVPDAAGGVGGGAIVPAGPNPRMLARRASRKMRMLRRELEGDGAATLWLQIPLPLCIVLFTTGTMLASIILLYRDSLMFENARRAADVRWMAERVAVESQHLITTALTTPSVLAVGTARLQLQHARSELLTAYESIISSAREQNEKWTLTSPFQKDLDRLLFKFGCLRKNQSTCARVGIEDSFDTTLYGLDALIRSFANEAYQLSVEPQELLLSGNELYHYLVEDAYQDISGGLEDFQRLFAADAVVGETLAQYVLVACLCVVVLGHLLYYTRVFRPFLKRSDAEYRRVANLLTELPTEIDVTKIIKESIANREAKLKAKQPAAATGPSP